MDSKKIFPSIEDALELSEIETLHPGGLDLSKRIGEVVDMKDKRVLEVACGRGVFACYYAKNYKAKITGLDLSPDMIKTSIERAKREGVENLANFKVADALDTPLPFPDNSFDIAVNECAFGIAEDPQRHLNEMVRVTKVDGYIVLHLSVWLKELPEAEKEDIEKRLGGALFTLEELKKMFRRKDTVEILYEDWSGIEQIRKTRPDRKIKTLNDVFSPQERLIILFRVLKKFGLKGLFYLAESMKQLTSLYENGTVGYYLVVCRKEMKR